MEILSRHREEQQSVKDEILITKDFLGGLSSISNQELDLDFKSGTVFLQRCSSPNSPLSSSTTSPSSSVLSENKNKNNEEKPPSDKSEIQDLNYPPSSTPTLMNNLLEESCLELRLVPSSQTQSVCTLDKVKSALQRAEKEAVKKRSPPPPRPPSPPPPRQPPSNSVFAAGCPGCFLYVITSKTNPKCPSCDAIVTTPSGFKKPRIDLNESL